MKTELPATIDLPPHLSAEFTATLDAAAAVDHLLSEFIAKAEKRLVELRQHKCSLLERASAELGLTKEQMMKYGPVRVVGGTQLVLGEEGKAGDDHKEAPEENDPFAGLPDHFKEMAEQMSKALSAKGVKIGMGMVKIELPKISANEPERADDEAGPSEQSHAA